MANYLKYDTFEDALAKANDEGSHLNLPYFQGKGASRYISYPQELTSGQWALQVDGYVTLTDSETANITTSVTFSTINDIS